MFTGKIAVTFISAEGLEEPASVALTDNPAVQINPYVVLEIDGEEVDKTSIKFSQDNPVWNEKLYSDEIVSAENIKFIIKHGSQIDEVHDLIGECTLNIHQLLDGSEDIRNTLTIEEELVPKGTLKLDVCLEKRVNQQNLQRRKAIRQNKIHYHRHHAFKVHTYRAPAKCVQCQGLLFGIWNQGYKCRFCSMSVHKRHYKKVGTDCPGAKGVAQKEEEVKLFVKLNIPHRLRPQTFFWEQCDQCGEVISAFDRALQCIECKNTYHKAHEGMLPSDCGNTKEMKEYLSEAYGDQLFRQESNKENEETDEEDDTLDLADLAMCIQQSDVFITAQMKPYLEDFRFLNVLGQGAYGKVFKVKHKTTSSIFALKAINKDTVLEIDEIGIVALEKEILGLGTKNNFLTRLHSTFQTEQHLFLVMEFISGGDLFFHLMRKKWFPENHARFYAAEIAVAIMFLHSEGILHRDLKLDNVLLDSEGHVKVADFGMCKVGMKNGEKTSTLCGTPDYIAPEVLKGECYGISCDWWSYGVILFEMLVGSAPFTGNEDQEIFENIINSEPVYPRLLGTEARILIENLLEKDVDQRLASQVGREIDIFDQQFFSGLDWEKLRERQLAPPFIPASDKLNVDLEFVQARPQLSATEDSFVSTGKYKNAFKGFDSYNQNYSI